MPGEANDRLNLAFIEIGKQISAARPDVIIAIAADHWVNFYLDNFPTITLGVGDEHDGPPEPPTASFPHKSFAGDPAFGRFILETAPSRNFEAPISYRLIDDGICVPLCCSTCRKSGHRPCAAEHRRAAIMSCRRFLQRTYPEDLRVATGAQSLKRHFIIRVVLRQHVPLRAQQSAPPGCLALHLPIRRDQRAVASRRFGGSAGPRRGADHEALAR
jgi:hypothetical protein